jgi:hypothetical protein
MTTITINERTAKGKTLLEFLQTFGDAKTIQFLDSPYNKTFVKKIEGSRKQIKEGKGKKIQTADLWK